MLGLIGKKIGMTRTFTDEGNSLPVTVLELGPCVVTQQKDNDNDGYSAIQVGFKEVDEAKLNKPLSGHFKKNNLKFYKHLNEFRVDTDSLSEYKVGEQLTVDMFKQNELVDITGTSKGRGFAGVMKRHNFSGKNATHGTHKSFRGAGAIGQCATPSRVFKGQKMAGHMGNNTVTIHNLEIVRIDKDRNMIMVKGSVPGHKNANIIVKKIKQ